MFVLFGIYHGFLLILYQFFLPLLRKIRIWLFVKIIFFFHFICFSWLIFRAQSISQLFKMLKALLYNFHFAPHTGLKLMALNLALFTSPVIFIQIFQFRKNDLMAVYQLNTTVKVVFYLVCCYLILILGVSGAEEFIYFTF